MGWKKVEWGDVDRIYVGQEAGTCEHCVVSMNCGEFFA